MTDPPKFPLTRMTQRTSAKGNPYFTGLLGNTTLLLFKTPDGDSEYGQGWTLYIQERPAKRSSKPKAPSPKPQKQERPFIDDDVPFLG